jgi:hypothetical protein
MVSVPDRGLISERPRWVRRLAGATVVSVGLALLAFVVLSLVQDASLWVLGRRTTAQVVGAWIEQDVEARPETPTFRWFIRYQFGTPDGREVTGVSRVSAAEWAAMGHSDPLEVVNRQGGSVPQPGVGAVEDGGSVDVVYLPAYPAHNRPDESRFVPVLACAYVPLILLGWAGLAAGRGLLQNT